MNFPKLLRHYLLVMGSVISGLAAIGQVKITGTVYDVTQSIAMPGVTVMGTSGAGTITDSTGKYTIRLPLTDSIYFSYLGKATPKFPVRDIYAGEPFDMSLHVYIDSLPTVFVQNKNYRQDSLANRKEYENIFNYSKDYVTSMKSGKRGGMGVGLDFDMLFSGAQNRRMEAFQKRLEWEEKENYVDHRFTRAIVRKVTGLEPPALDTFMKEYRPSYEFIQSCENEYEFYHFIQEWGKSFSELWKQEHEHQQ